MIKKQQGMLKTKCSSGGGGYCCDTECCMPNRWLELLCLLLILGSFFLPGFSSDAYANAPGALGVCNIEDPVYYETASTYNRVYFGYVPETTTGTARNHPNTDVYPYGSNNTKDSTDTIDMHNKPLYWRVLNTKANNGERLTNEGATPALFMLTEYGLSNYISWDIRDKEHEGNHRWEYIDNDAKKTDSSLRIFLQGSSCNATLPHELLDGSYVNTNGKYTKGVYDECFSLEEQETILETTNSEITQKKELLPLQMIRYIGMVIII